MSSLPPLFSDCFPSSHQESYGSVNVLWYGSDFTQSKYPPGQEISEACTIICLLVARHIGERNIVIKDIADCPALEVAIAEAIIEGNAIHAQVVRKKLVRHPYLSAEEALQFGGPKLCSIREWVRFRRDPYYNRRSPLAVYISLLHLGHLQKFKVFHENLDCTLFCNIRAFLCDWYESPKASNLFILLITCGRTIIFTFQQKTKQVILFDSHGHNTKNSNRGLVVAQAPIVNLEELCEWYIKDVIHNCYQLEANQYELTCLYHHQRPKVSSSCHSCQCASKKK